jgi:hypothetical protein
VPLGSTIISAGRLKSMSCRGAQAFRPTRGRPSEKDAGLRSGPSDPPPQGCTLQLDPITF